MCRAFADRMAALSVAWVRVGYVQGNMNSDNCLLSGRTMDYGPFGFVEAYEPLWSPFTSDMERKFGFERQPLAAQVNVMTFARALLPMLAALDGGDVAAAAEALQKIVDSDTDGYAPRGPRHDTCQRTRTCEFGSSVLLVALTRGRTFACTR